MGSFFRGWAATIRQPMSDSTAIQPGFDILGPWRSAPEETSAAFQAGFRAVSRAIQLALREYLPRQYFAAPERYREKSHAFPMVAYRCSRPIALRQDREYTYDILNGVPVENFFWSVRLRLPKELMRMEAEGIFTGDPALARIYAARRHASLFEYVRRHRRLLYRILATETKLVNALIQFAVALPRAQSSSRVRRRFARSWRRSLARIYPGVDASPFFEELFGVATRALAQSMEEWRRIRGEFPAESPTTSA